MAGIVIVDSGEQGNRASAWKKALEQANFDVEVEDAYPEREEGFSRWSQDGTVLVHSHNLILDLSGDTGRHWFGEHAGVLLNGRRTVIVFSGGPIKELEAGRFAHDGGLLDLPKGVYWVSRSLRAEDAPAVVAAFRSHDPSSDPAGLVAALNRKKWPESLVAAYLVWVARDEGIEISDGELPGGQQFWEEADREFRKIKKRYPELNVEFDRDGVAELFGKVAAAGRV